MKVLVLGATGSVGRYVASELGRSPAVDVVALASRTPREAERVAGLLGGPSDRARPVTVDLDDRASTIAAFADADVVVSAAGPAYLLEPAAVSAAAETGTSYLSLADDHVAIEDVLEHHDQAVRSGATVVSGCGLSPGISNLLVALCAQELETIEEIDIAVARSSVESDGAASAMHLLFEMTQPAPAISDSMPSETPAGTGPRLVYFPEPVGWVETFRSGHPEVATLPRRYADLRALRFRIGLTEKAAMDVARAAAGSGLIKNHTGRRAFIKASNPLRPLLEKMPPRGPAWTALRIDVRGHRNGRTESISFGAADHLRNFAAVPIALLAGHVGSGKVDSPGVHTIEEVVDAGSFLAEVGRRGVRVARLESERV